MLVVITLCFTPMHLGDQGNGFTLSNIKALASVFALELRDKCEIALLQAPTCPAGLKTLGDRSMVTTEAMICYHIHSWTRLDSLPIGNG